MMFLVSGKNREGYLHALSKAFGVCEMPSGAALSKFRKKISFKFFKFIFDQLIKQNNDARNTWRGLYIYAVDGWDIEVPRTDDLEKNDFKGRVLSDYRETHNLRMYSSHCYDVINKTTKDFGVASFKDELFWAKKMIPKLEQNSLTLYDRLYPTKGVMNAHIKHGSYFLIRCRSDFTLKEIKDFMASDRKISTFILEGQEVYLRKIKNPKTQKYDTFVTNLPEGRRSKLTIRSLYNQRWEVENSFRDFAQVMKMEQFHSTFLNGILQEIYVHLWLVNFTRINEDPGRKVEFGKEYEKSNFKLLIDWVIGNLKDLIINTRQELFKDFFELVAKSKTKRKRHSRSYPRQLKCAASPYPYNNTTFKIGESSA